VRLEGKVCVITGSSRGLGEAFARGFAAEGAHVVVTYSEQADAAEKVAVDIGAELVVQLDQRDRESVKAAFAKVGEKYGRIDVLVNNAGINRTADFDKQTDEEWDEVIDVNLTGLFRCCQEVLPHLADNGRIINIGSLSGQYGGPRTPSYAAAKAGVMQLTYNVARFLAPRGVCVNTLSPGVIASDLTAKTMSPDVKETALSLMLLKRFARYDEMVGGAIFLASDESSYMTGQTLSINGGAWVH
jgi:NAD(P)-dependent dehydrogenase (short-subunit alcohol dehydrogenase family)